MNSTCPSCGYCPHCGRSAQPYRFTPIIPYGQPWWTSPDVQWVYPTTTGTLTTTGGISPYSKGTTFYSGGQ